MNVDDWRELEHRLTKLEGLPHQLEELGVSLSGQISRVDDRIKDARRILDLHLTQDEKCMGEHDVVHAKQEGFREGQRSIRKGDMAILTVAVGVVSAAVAVLERLI